MARWHTDSTFQPTARLVWRGYLPTAASSLPSGDHVQAWLYALVAIEDLK